tara:strand:+ start:2531 stop:3169 length:639 start_codon:yes stop_codon:yes gene_type:complete
MKKDKKETDLSKKDSIINKIDRLGVKVIANTLRNTRDMALKYPKGEDGLTDRQRIFVELYSANEGRLTPTECARQSGYKPERASVTACELLNIKKTPKVVQAIVKRREEIANTHKVEMDKHVQELARLRETALTAKSYSAAVNAERLRGQAAGLYIDRKEIRTGSIDSMSRAEVLSQLKELGLDGRFRKENNKTILSVEEEKDQPKDITPEK